MIENVLTHHFPKFKLSSKEAIFGDTNSEGNSIINTILFLARQFIYRQKFTTKTLDEVAYINYMKQEIKSVYDAHLFKGESERFIQDWACILDRFDVQWWLG